MHETTNKRPRQWAQEIAALKTTKERRAALAELDPSTRARVDEQLKILWGRAHRYGRR